MKKVQWFCDYCGHETIGDPRGMPCLDCIALLKKTIAERCEFNEVRLYGQIWKFPIHRGFSMAVGMGEGRYVVQKMKRLARKAPSYRY